MSMIHENISSGLNELNVEENAICVCVGFLVRGVTTVQRNAWSMLCPWMEKTGVRFCAWGRNQANSSYLVRRVRDRENDQENHEHQPSRIPISESTQSQTSNTYSRLTYKRGVDWQRRREGGGEGRRQEVDGQGSGRVVVKDGGRKERGERGERMEEVLGGACTFWTRDQP